jgi:type I restriction enzyme M protein
MEALFGAGVDPLTNIEQVSFLIYLKLLDEEESTRELQTRLVGNGNSGSLFPKQAARYRWSKWRFKSGSDLRDFVRSDVFPYMASLVKDAPAVAEYFRDAMLRVDDPHVL